MKECNQIINNILTDTVIILKRPDPLQRQLLRESWVEFGIKLDEVNKETLDILEANK